MHHPDRGAKQLRFGARLLLALGFSLLMGAVLWRISGLDLSTWPVPPDLRHANNPGVGG